VALSFSLILCCVKHSCECRTRHAEADHKTYDVKLIRTISMHCWYVLIHTPHAVHNSRTWCLGRTHTCNSTYPWLRTSTSHISSKSSTSFLRKCSLTARSTTIKMSCTLALALKPAFLSAKDMQARMNALAAVFMWFTEYSAACCRSTHVLGCECNQMSVGTVLPQLAL